MERQKTELQNRVSHSVYIYSAKLRPNRLGPNIQNQQKIKGPIQQHCIPSGRGRLRPPGPPGQGARRPPGPPSFLFVAGPIQGIQHFHYFTKNTSENSFFLLKTSLSLI